MPGSRAPGRTRLRRVAGLGYRAAAPVCAMRGAPRQDGAGVAEIATPPAETCR